MHTKYNTFIAAGLTVLMAGGLTAQEKTQHSQQKPQASRTEHCRAQDYVELDTLLGAEVVLEPSAEARREAKPGEDPERPTGSIEEFLVEADTGRIQWAVVSCGGFLGIDDKDVAVPVTLLTWRPEKQHFTLAATKAELEQQRAFDLEQARQRGADPLVRAASTSWKDSGHLDETYEQDGERAAQEPENSAAVREASLTVMPGRYICTSELDDFGFHASDEPLGEVQTAFVDPAQLRLDFVVVSHGGTLGIDGTENLVPFTATRVATKNDQERVLFVDMPAQKVASIAAYTKPDKGVVSQAAIDEAMSHYSRTFMKKEQPS